MNEHRTGEALLDALLQTTTDFVFFKDVDRRFVRVSRSFEALLGRSEAEIVGRRDEDLFPPEIAEVTSAEDRRVIETGEPLLNRLEGGRMVTGEEAWVLTSKLRWEDPSGRVLGLLGISKDYTEIKRLQDQLEHSNARLDAIAEAVPFPIAATRVSDQTMVFANSALGALRGTTREEIVGVPALDLYDYPQEREALQAELARSGEVNGLEATVLDPQGNLRIHRLYMRNATMDGEPTVVGVGIDVTEEKEREQELELLTAEKDVLLREVNHRVNNNLATLLALLDNRKAAGATAEETLASLERAIRGLATVHQLLSDAEWSPVRLTDLARQLIPDAAALDPDRLEVRNRARLRVSGASAHHIALLLSELAVNSAKYAGPDLAIRVTTERHHRGVCIRYSDNGRGYDDEMLQGANWGHGLELVKGLVEHSLGGSLELSNERGATAEIVLPAWSIDDEMTG